MIDQICILGYALLLLSGAYFGLKAGSKISLIMGIISGVLIGFGDWLVIRNPKNGFLYLMIVGGLLVVVFLQRLLKTKKMMPSGMLLSVGTLFFVFAVYQFFNC